MVKGLSYFIRSSTTQASALDLEGVVVRAEGETAGGIYTGHKLGKVDKHLPNNKEKLSEPEMASSILGTTISALQGGLPLGTFYKTEKSDT